MNPQTRHSWFVALDILVFLPSMCWAGRFTAAPRPPIEGYQNQFGGGVSVGKAWNVSLDLGYSIGF